MKNNLTDPSQNNYKDLIKTFIRIKQRYFNLGLDSLSAKDFFGNHCKIVDTFSF